MTKAELIDRIARSRDLPPEISKKLIGQILGLAFDELASYFARSRVTRSQSPRFTFPHFGTFTKKRRSARRGVNPRTLEPIQIEACNTIDFKVSRELREAMNPRAGSEEAELEAAPPPIRSRKPVVAAVKVNKKAARTKARAAAGARRAAAAGPGKRRLTPRDEAELAAGTTPDPAASPAVAVDGASHDDQAEALPSSPMQRVKGRRRTRSRSTG
ncbi:MAG: HU family DNA-binding protein [Myxococcales bacterium]|nr:HU family DNA-binding protein [Myxococcales bacterium]